MKRFQSTPSARRATGGPRRLTRRMSDFNPRPPRGERPMRGGYTTEKPNISIHALREESDLCALRVWCFCGNFNPRPPRGERLCWALTTSLIRSAFQSTPSARRATVTNPAAFTGGRISIHALREESDQRKAGTDTAILYFNPRPPRGERRCNSTKLWRYKKISIHALREESDKSTEIRQ